MIGQTIAQYTIVDKLGAGGMGEVFLAEDTKLKRRVALKFLTGGCRSDTETIARFKSEAQALAAISHPNIVSVFEISEHEGHPFIAMEFIDGSTLTRYANEAGRSVDQLLDVFTQVSQGLDKAHNAGVIHRDIKPDNILIDEDGRARILDFGLAKLKDSAKLTKEHTTRGTVQYMSPEQTEGSTVDQRTDIWALGVVLYELMDGRPPFRGDYDQAIIYSILHEDPPHLSNSRREVPGGLEEIVRRSLRKDPAERYQSVADLLEDLESVRTGDVPDKAHTQALPSIAVLPFANMSTDPENEFFSDGLAEEIINALTKVRDLRVVARTSAFSFKGKEIDVREIGRKLNVETLLEGSVRRAGKRLRVTAQLVKTADGYHLWSERYDREMADVFEIQDEITRAIVDHLKVSLLGECEEAIRKRQTENVDALTLYMKGRFFWNKRTEENFKKSIAFFQQALDADPDYAMAHVGMADVFNLYGFYNLLPPRESFAKAKEVAARALQLDDKLAAAHTSLAYVTFYHDWNWEEAEEGFLRAQSLDPGYAFAHSYHGNLLVALGRHDEALIKWHRGLDLDPLATIQNAGNGWALYHMRKFDVAIERLLYSLEMDPSFMVAHAWLGRTYEQVGRFDDAIREFELAVEFSERMPGTLAELGRVQAGAGHRDAAKQLEAELQTVSGTRYVPPVDRALLHAALGDKNKAFECMDQAFEDRSPDLVMLNVEPRFDALRSDSRFDRLVKAVGLPA